MTTPHLAIPDEALAHFCRERHIRTLSLFGSALRDDFRSNSDVDLLVEFEAGAHYSLFDLVTLQDELSDLLGREVDLVEASALRNPFRRREILRTRRCLYAA